VKKSDGVDDLCASSSGLLEKSSATQVSDDVGGFSVFLKTVGLCLNC